MQPANFRTRWIAAAACVLSFSQACMAEDGVIRLSDAHRQPAVVRLKQHTQRPPQTMLAPPDARQYYQSAAYSPQDHFAAYARMYGVQKSGQPQRARQIGYLVQDDAQPLPQPPTESQRLPQPPPARLPLPPPATSPMQTPQTAPATAPAPAPIPETAHHTPISGGMVMNGGYGYSCGEGCGEPGGCGCGSCDCGNCDGSCNGCGLKNMPNGKFRKMLKSHRDACYQTGYQNRVRLLAGATPPDGCNGWLKRYWRGQQLNYLNRNQHLSNTLFGWLVPSGCGGQGCPPVGKYHVTYADDPGYTHPQDTQRYGAQGYGTHVSVPLPPTVRYSYNYSWGTPSSRLTQVGSYDPQTSYEPLQHRTW